MDWREYQEHAAEFFRGLGLDAETDVRIEGVRTTHDIDVRVSSQRAGMSSECTVSGKVIVFRTSPDEQTLDAGNSDAHIFDRPSCPTFGRVAVAVNPMSSNRPESRAGGAATA